MLTNFSDLTVTALAIYGVATIIANEYVFNWLHKLIGQHTIFGYLLSCNRCLSVWVGIIFSILGFGFTGNPLVDAPIAYTTTCLIDSVIAKLSS